MKVMKSWTKHKWEGSLALKEDTRLVRVSRVGEKLYEVQIALKRGGFSEEVFSHIAVVEKFQRFILPMGVNEPFWALVMPQSFYKIFPELKVKKLKGQ